MKRFEQFVNELNWQTYDSASDKLRKFGHEDRADEIGRHRSTHKDQLRAFDKYAEVNKTPFTIWDGRGKKLPVYFSGFEVMELVDEMADGSAGFLPEFIFKDVNGNWQHYRNFSGMFNIIFSADKRELKGYGQNRKFVSTGKPGTSITSWGEPTRDNQYGWSRFTNRKDAMRFRNLIVNDEWLQDTVDKAVEETDAGSYWTEDDNRFTSRDMFKYLAKLSLNLLWSPNAPKDSMFDSAWERDEDGGQTYRPDYGTGPEYKYTYVPKST